ncbi:MAG TPA: OB-fold domain-containing protein, partial [Rhodoferax sp.]
QLVRPGRGTLLEYVTIHVPMVPGMPVPCIAGDIRFAEGVIEEGVIAVSDESSLQLGMELKAVATPGPSSEVYTCQFVPATMKESQ